MSNELSDLILTIDTREKEQNRINSTKAFFEERGACLDVEAITIKDDSQITSMDYSIEGNFRGKEVKLGISAKSIVDLSATIGNLSNELARGYLRFNEIGFILITGCYETVLSTDELHAFIRNKGAEYKNKDDRADILNTTSMFNALASWERAGIHCRQVLYEHQFPQAVMSILTFITKESHEGVGFNTKGVTDPVDRNKFNFVNANIHLGVDGMGVKTALKLRDYLIAWNYPPNMHFATSLSEEDLQEAIGKKTGSALYQAYRCRDGWTESQTKGVKTANLLPEYIKNSKDNSKNVVEHDTKEKLVKSHLNQSDNNPEYAYLHEVTPFIEVTKGKFQNGGELQDVVTEFYEKEYYDVKHGTNTSGGIKSQSSSADITQEQHLAGSSQDVKQSRNNIKLGTRDNLQSQRGLESLSSCDMAEDDLSLSTTPPLQPSAVTPSNLEEIKARQTIKSLEDAIVDRVYEKPVESTVIMREFATRGHSIPEVHEILLNSKKLHKYKQGGVVMICYNGVKAEKELDVGV